MAAASGYDAFISYSHHHDAVLGPVLQTDLERFAKPWYRMRALRVFLDTANLGANPALWPSIEDGLGSSRWLILLASADAARSDGVEHEVRWWLGHRPLDRLLVVGTSPGLAWDKRAKDWAADAPVPQALRGTLDTEPLWVDLSEPQLHSGKPVIPAERVAAVAAPIRGMPKDMLIGEHLRQHRRAMRLAGGAVAVLAILTALAIVASVFAYGQRNSAIQQRDKAFANLLAVEVGELTATNPSLAAQFDIVAHQMNPTFDNKTRLLDTTTTPLSSRLTGPAGSIFSVAYSPDGRILAAGSSDKKIWLWKVTNLARPLRLGPSLTGPTDVVASVAFSPDGRILAAGSIDHRVWLWNMADPDRPHLLGPSLTGPRRGVTSVAFSPDGRILAAGSQDDKVWLWNMANPDRPQPLGPPLTGPTGGVYSVAFSPDGRILAVGSQDDKVWLWNMANPARPHLLGPPLTGPGDVVTSLAFTRSGQILAAGSDDQTVWLWNMANPARPHLLGPPLTGSTAGVSSVAFSPDGQILAAGNADGTVRLWNFADPASPRSLGQPLADGPIGSVVSVAFSPNGRTLATGTEAGTVQLWNLPSNVLILGPVESVAFSPDGRILAAGTGDDKVWLWNMADPDRPQPFGPPLVGPTSGVSSVAFSPDGRTLAAGDDGGGVGVWHTASGQRTASLAEGSPVYSVAFSPTGQVLALGFDNGNVALFRQDLSDLTYGIFARLICDEVRGNMTRAQWTANAPGQPYQKTCPAYP
jgi:WD40 repeat protein